jgi:putative phosphoesterase
MQVIWQTFPSGVSVQYNARMAIGVISDTHGLLRPEAMEALGGSELILHAGDLGSAEVLRALERFAPVVAVRGNVDLEAWAERLHPVEVAEFAEKTFYLLHRIADLDLKPEAAGIAAVIYGHSHQPLIEWRDGVLFFNPGSAGPRRFSLPVTVGRIEIVDGELRPEIIQLL